MTPLPPAAGGVPLRAWQTTAMASRWRVTVAGPGPASAVRAAFELVSEVERQCSRFRPDSALSRANRDPAGWHELPRWCLQALAEAHAAYLDSGGAFDPRVLGDLVRLGYADSWPAPLAAPLAAPPDTPLAAPPGTPLAAIPAGTPAATPAARPALGPWRLELAGDRACLGGLPVDLGGIGKGLAVRWAGAVLAQGCPNALVDAGGDCLALGAGPEGTGWRVGVEDPRAPEEHVAVLALVDLAACTSSVSLRRWHRGGAPVHHLLDPASGAPGGAGLESVTVVGPDPAAAEVMAKRLFLRGRAGIGAAAAELGAAALWVDDHGAVAYSPALAPALCWMRR